MSISVFRRFLRCGSGTGLERKIGYNFRDKKLLNLAITHRSAVDGFLQSYERLEFLGDSVLQQIVTEYLFKKYPLKNEGDLTVIRSVLVNRDWLYDRGLKLEIQNYLILEKSIDVTNVSTMKTLISDVIEALLAAIYLDGGIKVARSFVYKWIFDSDKLNLAVSNFNYKGKLLELCQKKETGYLCLKPGILMDLIMIGYTLCL